MKNDTKKIVAAIEERLADFDFRRAKAAVFTREECPDVLAWVGLNRTRRRGQLAINPVVGVRNQQVEKLVAELVEEKYDPFFPPTAAMNIGYLSDADRYQVFTFDASEPGQSDSMVASLVESIVGPGLDFVKRNKELSRLGETLLTSRRLMPEQTAYRLPSAMYLLGRCDDASEALELKLAEIGSRTDPAAIRFLGFAERLTKKLGRRSS